MAEERERERQFLVTKKDNNYFNVNATRNIIQALLNRISLIKRSEVFLLCRLCVDVMMILWGQLWELRVVFIPQGVAKVFQILPNTDDLHASVMQYIYSARKICVLLHSPESEQRVFREQYTGPKKYILWELKPYVCWRRVKLGSKFGPLNTK